jgi:hypothetical protein
VLTTSGRRYWANSSVGLGSNSNSGIGNSKDEHWPVKVTIHNVDYHTMTLSGTMEAYNIPDKTATNQGAHIITFLEGEIIDFNTHTLETKNFKADAEIDSTYWRELQPFKNLTDDEIVKNLVSKRWLTENLARGWILMRWKGMFCSTFVAPNSCPPLLDFSPPATLMTLNVLTNPHNHLRTLLRLPFPLPPGSDNFWLLLYLRAAR